MMSLFEVQSLISTVDKLIFSHTGEHLDDLETAILEGTFEHQKYAEIAQNNYRSEKYVKDIAGQLWKKVSKALGEDVSKSNIKSSLQRYHYSNFHNCDIVNISQVDRNNSFTELSDNNNQQNKIKQEAKLEIVSELIKEGLTVEKVSKILNLPLELVQKEINMYRGLSH